MMETGIVKGGTWISTSRYPPEVLKRSGTFYDSEQSPDIGGLNIQHLLQQ